MKYTYLAYLINRSCYLRKEFEGGGGMVFTQYFNFNVDTATAVALKLPLKAESVGSCVGAGTKLWSSLFGTCKELLDNFSSSVFFCTYRSHIISWLHRVLTHRG